MERRGVAPGLTAPRLPLGFDGNRVGQMSLTAAANGLLRWAGTRPRNSFCSTANVRARAHGKIKPVLRSALLLNSAFTAKRTNCGCFALGSRPFLHKIAFLGGLGF